MPRSKRESNPITKALADRLDDLMAEEKKRQNLSQNEICKLMGVPSSSYSEWAADTKTPSLDLLVKVANYFACSVDYVLGLTNIRSKDINVAAACKNTGLTEDALWSLRRLKDEVDTEHLFIMNTLIASQWMDDTVRYIGEVRKTQRSVVNEECKDIYELEEIQDEAIAQAKKVLEEAGVKEYKIISRGEFLDHQMRTLLDCFNLMLQVDLFHEQGELYAGK